MKGEKKLKYVYLKFYLSLNSGNVNRECLLSGHWNEPNFDRCVDESYENMLNEVSQIAFNFSVSSYQLC